MKASYDPEIFLGKFDGSKENNLSMAEIFNFKTKKHKPLQTSTYFHSNRKSEGRDPIDIRGSSANWENERFTTEKGMKVPNEFFG